MQSEIVKFRLEDQFLNYPDPDDVDIQEKLAHLFEFAELASERYDEKLPGDSFFKQQRLYQRLGYVYNRLAFLAEAGVGKTLGQICLAEYLKANDLRNKRAYFITGSSQIEDYKRQLTQHQGSGLTAGGKASMVGIKDYYEIKSYGVFLGEIRRAVEGMDASKVNRFLIEKFSDSYFFLDEIQFMKISSGQVNKVKRRYSDYWLLWRLCHVVERSRITIASARPLTNTVKEFGYAMNLILPLYNQMSIRNEFAAKYVKKMGLRVEYGEEIDWDAAKLLEDSSIEEVSGQYMEMSKSYLNGRIIFVASSETGIKLSYLPLRQPTASKEDQQKIEEMRKNQENRKDEYSAITSQLRFLTFAVTKSGKLDLQGESYKRYMETSSSSLEQGLKDRNQRELLTFVFPRATNLTENWGKKAETYWLKEKQDEYVYRLNVSPVEPEKTLQWYLRNSLESCSVKMAYVRHQAVNYPGKGYSFFDIVRGGGARIFALALEQGGPVLLSTGRTNSSFRGYNPRKDKINYRQIPAGRLGSQLAIAPRYGLITGKQSRLEMTKILDVYNHPDNLHGDYMKHIIISKRGLVGTNLTAVKYINSFFMAHNPADLYQAIRRAVRATSHKALVEEWEAEHSDEPFEVEVNILTCIYPSRFQRSQATTDLGISIRTFEKNRNTSCVIRAYKNLAMTGWILDGRNTLDESHDNKEECDYMTCKLDYPSGEPDVQFYDYSNYLFLYAGYEIQQEGYRVIERLRKEGSLSLVKYVNNEYGETEPARSIAFLAAASIVEDSLKDTQYEVKDRYGFRCNVIEKSGILYLSRKNTAIPEGPFTTYYTQNLIAVKKRGLKEILEERTAKQTAIVFRKVESYEYDMPELSVFLGKLNTNIKAAFLEQLLTRIELGEDVPKNTRQILEIFTFSEDTAGNLITLGEPTGAIRSVSESTSKKFRFEIVENENVPVYVHNVYAFEQLKAAAGMSTRAMQSIGRLRIFRSGEDGWRDTNKSETIVYRSIFQEKINLLLKDLENELVYGVISGSRPDTFVIMDRLFTDELELGKQPQGCVCSDIAHKTRILALMWYSGVRAPLDIGLYIDESTPVEDKRDALHNYERVKDSGEFLYREIEIQTGLSYCFKETEDTRGPQLAPDDMVHFFHLYLFASQNYFSKPYLCSVFADHLFEQGKIFSSDLNKYQIADCLARQQGLSFQTAKEAQKQKRRNR